MKDIYKTVWEIKMKSVIDLAADRGAFVDQSQVRSKIQARVFLSCTASPWTSAKLATACHRVRWKNSSFAWSTGPLEALHFFFLV